MEPWVVLQILRLTQYALSGKSQDLQHGNWRDFVGLESSRRCCVCFFGESGNEVDNGLEELWMLSGVTTLQCPGDLLVLESNGALRVTGVTWDAQVLAWTGRRIKTLVALKILPVL
jgi:hypothetical protein